MEKNEQINYLKNLYKILDNNYMTCSDDDFRVAVDGALEQLSLMDLPNFSNFAGAPIAGQLFMVKNWLKLLTAENE